MIVNTSDPLAKRLSETVIHQITCKNGHHVFPTMGPVCQCGECDIRNDPPRIICPMCNGDGEITGEDK